MNLVRVRLVMGNMLWLKALSSSWIIVILFLSNDLLIAQQPTFIFENFDHITPVPDAFDMIQDSDGYLWLATFDGLWKFDGYSFEEIELPNYDSQVSQGDILSSIFQDELGQIWCAGIRSGVFYSNQDKSEFQHFPKPLQSSRINSISQDEMGNYWFGGDRGLEIYKPEGGNDYKKIISHPVASTLNRKGALVNTTFKDDKLIWIGTTKGLFKYDQTSQILESPIESPDMPKSSIVDIKKDPQGKMWFSSFRDTAQFYVYDEAKSQCMAVSGFGDNISSDKVKFDFDQNHKIWISTMGKGLYAYNLLDKSIFLDSRENSNLNHFRYFRRPMVDNTGNLWILVDGLQKYTLGTGFNAYKHPLNFTQSNSSITNSEKYLWAAYRDAGLLRIDKESNEIKSYFGKDYDSKITSIDPITSILKISEKELLIARVNGIHLLNTQTNKIKDIRLSGVNRSIYLDRSDHIWIGNMEGLYQYDKSMNLLNHFRLTENKMWDEYLQTIVEDKNDNLWIATDGNGLLKYDRKNKTLKSIEEEKITSRRINDLWIGSDECLWIGTDIGLIKKVDDQYTFYNESNGLSNDFIASIIEDQNGSIWLSTNNGISKFNPRYEQFTNYNRKDGTINSLYYPRVKSQSKEGYIYFGGRNGIDFFHPEELKKIENKLNLNIRTVELSDGLIIYPQEIDSSKTIKVPRKNKFIRIKYTATNIATPKEIRYAYKISEISDEWFDAGTDREILLSNLNFGNYTVFLKAYYQSDTEKHFIKSIHILVPTPFYLHPFFILSSGLFLLIGTYLLIKKREQNIRKKEKTSFNLKRRMIQLEQKALRSQMNPHFIFNSMNSIQDFILTKDESGALKFLNKFARLIRQVLNYSGQNQIPLSDEIQLIKDYLDLELMRFPKKYTYDIELSPEISMYEVELPPFLIQPLLENSIQHGFKNIDYRGKLNIRIDGTQDCLIIAVEDNGVGRATAIIERDSHKSYSNGIGLFIIEQRIKMLQELHSSGAFKIIDLQDDLGRPTGTKVILTIPVD